MVETSYNYQLLSCYVFARESIAPIHDVSLSQSHCIVSGLAYSICSLPSILSP